MLKVCIVGALLILFSAEGFAASISSAQSGNWNATSTWTGGVVPGINDNVTINNGHNITLTANASCASLILSSGGSTTTLTVTGYTLDITGNFTINQATSNNRQRNVNVGTGTLECGSLTTVNPGADSRPTIITVTTGTVTVSGNITMGSTTVRNYIQITGNGTLNLGGTMTGGDFIPSSTASINFNGTNLQTIPLSTTAYGFTNIRTNNPAGVVIAVAITATNVTGNFSVESGFFSNAGFAIAGVTGKTFTVHDGAEFRLAGTTSAFPTIFTPVLDPTSTVTFQGTGNQNVPGLTYGNLKIAGSLTKTCTGAVTIQSDLLISSTFSGSTYSHNIKGDFTNNGTLTVSTSTYSFTGTSPQTISGTGAISFYRMTATNATGISIQKDITVTNLLTLTSGIINTSAFKVIVSVTGSVSGGSQTSFVDGNLQKFIAAATAAKTFEIGDASSYTPVVLAISGTTNATGSITCSTTTGDHPQISGSEIDPDYSVNRFWTIINTGVTGITSYAATFNFPASDIDPGSLTSSFITENYSSSAWHSTTTGTLTATSTQATGVTLFGDFQVGQKFPRKYRTTSTGNWNQPTTWETSKNGINWSPATTYPSYHDGTIVIRSPHQVTVTPALGSDTVDQVTVDAGAALVINVNPSGYWLVFVNGDGTDLTIDGILEYQDDVLHLVNGATMSVNSTGVFRFNFSYGGTYRITIPTANWDINSTLEIVACNQLAINAGLNQSFGNFTWNYPTQTANINLGGALTTVNGNFTSMSTGSGQLQLTGTTSLTLNVGKDFILSGGIVDFANGSAAAKVFNLSGNYNQTGGTFNNSNSNLLSFNFLGSGKTFSQTAGTLSNAYINWNVNADASLKILSDLNVAASRTFNVSGILDCGITTAVKGSGSFLLNPAAGLIMGSPDGISSSGATGNIQTSTRTFSNNADYTYNGTSPQITGAAMPSYVRNLTTDNNSGVSLTSGTTIKATLSLVKGVFSIGANTLGFHTGGIPVVRSTGTITTIPASSLKFGEASFTGGAAFSLPAGLFTSPPVITNLTINRANSITLNEQLMSISGIVTCSGPLVTNDNLLLLSTASKTALISGSSTGTITGDVTLQRYLPSSFGYHYLSTPFSTGTVADFGSYIDLNATFPTFYSYDENKNTSGWTVYTNSAGSLQPLNGYAGNFGPVGGPVTISVNGSVNNGTFSKNFFSHHQTYTNGFNLAGNPYPSPVNWDAASGWTKTNIDNAVYFFNTGSTDQYSGTYSSYVNGISSDGSAGPVIPAMQGFFVHVSGIAPVVTGTLGMTNSVRTDVLTPVYHKDQAAFPLVRIKGYYTGHEDRPDYAVVATDGTSASFDPDNDALKLMNTDPEFINIYSFAGSEKLSINRCTAGSVVTIPLGITTARSGSVTIDFSESQNTEGYFIYLYDKNLRKYTDLGKDPVFNLYTEKDYNNERYSLVFSSNKISENPSDEELSAYCSGGEIFIFTKNSVENTRIMISDMSGRLVWTGNMAGSDRMEIRPGISNGIYIVTCISSSDVSSCKVYFIK